MQQRIGHIIVNNIRYSGVLIVISLFLLTSCATKSISNPYGAKKSKPKPCKCGTRKRPGLTHQNNHFPDKAFAEAAKHDLWGINI